MSEEEYNREDGRLKAAYLSAKTSGNELAMIRALRELGIFYETWFRGDGTK